MIRQCTAITQGLVLLAAAGLAWGSCAQLPAGREPGPVPVPPAITAAEVDGWQDQCLIVPWQPDMPSRQRIVDMRSAIASTRTPLPGALREAFAHVASRSPVGTRLLLVGHGFDDVALADICRRQWLPGLEVAILQGGVRTFNRHQPFAADADLQTVEPALALAQLRTAGTLAVAPADDLAHLQHALPALASRLVPALRSADPPPRFHTGDTTAAAGPDDYRIAGGTPALIAQAHLLAVAPSVRTTPLTRPCYLP